MSSPDDQFLKSLAKEVGIARRRGFTDDEIENTVGVLIEIIDEWISGNRPVSKETVTRALQKIGTLKKKIAGK